MPPYHYAEMIYILPQISAPQIKQKINNPALAEILNPCVSHLAGNTASFRQFSTRAQEERSESGIHLLKTLKINFNHSECESPHTAQSPAFTVAQHL